MAAITITKENFEHEVTEGGGTVLLDFWASWCMPCRMMSPTIERVSEERPDVKVGKVNVDEQPELAQRFGIASIPSLVVFREGRVVSQTAGARPKGQVLALLG